MAPNAGAFTVGGNWTNNASTGAFVGGTGTVTFGGAGAQSIGGAFATTFNGLKVANASGITLALDTTVTGTLNFTSGIITTGAHVLQVTSSGSVTRTSGHVVGYLAEVHRDGRHLPDLRGGRREHLRSGDGRVRQRHRGG